MAQCGRFTERLHLPQSGHWWPACPAGCNFPISITRIQMPVLRCIVPVGLGSAVAAQYSETSLEIGSKVRHWRLLRMDCGPSTAYPSIRMQKDRGSRCRTTREEATHGYEPQKKHCYERRRGHRDVG